MTGHVAAMEAKTERQAGDALKYRQALFQLIRSNMGPLGAMAKGNIPFDAEVIKTNALRMEQLGAMIPDYLSTDTRKFSLSTDAKDNIWDNMADVKEKAQAFTQASAALQKASMTGDEAEYKKAIGMVGRTCKGCHDEYKKD
jgi:cytochrome c556